MSLPDDSPRDPTGRVAVFLLDDDPTIRAGIEGVLASHPQEFSLVASVGTAADARGVIESDAKVDVAILDLGLPDGHGSEFIERIAQTRPDTAVLVLTIFGDDESIFGALRAGAQGYLLKDASPTEVVQAVRHAWTGGAPMTPDVARRVVESFRPRRQHKAFHMTAREGEVLELLCHGKSYSEVATTLGISLTTVQTHVKNIYRKLDARSKTEAMKIAVQQRIFVP